MKNKRQLKERFIMSVSFVGIIVAVASTQLIGPRSMAAPAISLKAPTNTQPAAPQTPPPPPTSAAAEIKQPAKRGTISIDNEVNAKIKAFAAQTRSLDTEVLKLSLTAYYKAINLGYTTNRYLTVIDYSMPSTARRMWVLDLEDESVLYNTYVSHGKGSGENYARKFSNKHGSLMSSLGLFKTGSIYHGHYGEALVLYGLEERFNSNALARRIVVHAAHYVDESIIDRVGRLGRSFGCLALNQKVAKKIMHTIKNGSLVFCYYPDKDWLKNSKLLAS